jgi:hypothetical protein
LSAVLLCDGAGHQKGAVCAAYRGDAADSQAAGGAGAREVRGREVLFMLDDKGGGRYGNFVAGAGRVAISFHGRKAVDRFSVFMNERITILPLSTRDSTHTDSLTI